MHNLIALANAIHTFALTVAAFYLAWAALIIGALIVHAFWCAWDRLGCRFPRIQAVLTFCGFAAPFLIIAWLKGQL